MDFKYTNFGLLGGAIWVPSSILANLAIRHLGLAIAQGIWSGTTIIISFLWGVLLFGEQPSSIYFASGALVLLLVGIGGITFARLGDVKKQGKPPPPIPRRQSLKSFKIGSSSTQSVTSTSSPKFTSSLLPHSQNIQTSSYSPSVFFPIEITEKGNEVCKWEKEEEVKEKEENFVLDAVEHKPKKNKILGVIYAFGMGLLNASIFIPTKLIPENDAGINFLVSYGIGIAVTTPVYALLWFALVVRKIPAFNIKIVALPALISAALNSAGNVGSIEATKNLGLSVGYPLTQMSLLVAGLYSILVYGELKSKRSRVYYCLASCVLLSGAAVLALFGFSNS